MYPRKPAQQLLASIVFALVFGAFAWGQQFA
jgi:hypothetical protein